jgi:hypothetical protein
MKKIIVIGSLAVVFLLLLQGWGGGQFDPKKRPVDRPFKLHGPDPAVTQVKVTAGKFTPGVMQPNQKVDIFIQATMTNIGSANFPYSGTFSLVSPGLSVIGTSPVVTKLKSVPFGVLSPKQSVTLSHTVSVSYHPNCSVGSLFNYEVRIEFDAAAKSAPNQRGVDVDPSDASNRAKVNVADAIRPAYAAHFRTELLALINKERATAPGLSPEARAPLKFHSALDVPAGKHCQTMRTNNVKNDSDLKSLRNQYQWNKYFSLVVEQRVNRDIYTPSQAFQDLLSASMKPSAPYPSPRYHSGTKIYGDHTYIGIGHECGWMTVYFAH